MARKIIRIRANDRYVVDDNGWVSDSVFAVCPALATGLVRPVQPDREPEELHHKILHLATVSGTEKEARRDVYGYEYEGGMVEIDPRFDEALYPFAASFAVMDKRPASKNKVLVYRDRTGAPIAICATAP